MELSIIHLTDIHISVDSDIDSNILSMSKVISDHLIGIKKGYVVITGDIANTGHRDEYAKAKNLIDELIRNISDKIGIKLDVVLVPGNHDCNFVYDSQIRKQIIKNMDYDVLGQDDSVFKTCLSIQKDFWEFYSKYNEEPENKISYQIHDKIGDVSICFHCNNTAWMSEKNENTGGLFFPVKLIKNEKKSDINVSVYHHPINWFSPNKETNNKKEFQEYLEDISSIQLVGHEHEDSFRTVENKDLNIKSNIFSGHILYKKDNVDSGFQVLKINSQSKECSCHKYKWKDGIYICFSDVDFKLNNKNNRLLIVKDDYLKKKDCICIPIKLPVGIKKLSDIYIYPDLEELDYSSKTIKPYIDAESIVTEYKKENCILEGDSQIGKTSLLNMLYIKSYNLGYHPIFIDGIDIKKNQNIDNLIKTMFHRQYDDIEFGYDQYKNSENKILIIDNFQNLNLNVEKTKEIISCFAKKFTQILISIDTINGIRPRIRAEFSDFRNYLIKPFGHKKTNDLIKKYVNNGITIEDDQKFLDKIRSTFDQVRQVLGVLIPIRSDTSH